MRPHAPPPPPPASAGFALGRGGAATCASRALQRLKAARSPLRARAPRSPPPCLPGLTCPPLRPQCARRGGPDRHRVRGRLHGHGVRKAHGRAADARALAGGHDRGRGPGAAGGVHARLVLPRLPDHQPGERLLRAPSRLGSSRAPRPLCCLAGGAPLHGLTRLPRAGAGTGAVQPPVPLHLHLHPPRARARAQMQIAKVTATGSVVSPAYSLDTEWSLKSFKKEASPEDGSW